MLMTIDKGYMNGRFDEGFPALIGCIANRKIDHPPANLHIDRRWQCTDRGLPRS